MTKLIIAIALTLTSIFANAQLKGSGKTITKTYNYKNFDKLSFEGFNDNIDIEIGKSFKVEITLKEENEQFILFDYDQNEMELSLKVKPQAGKQLYENRATFKINITMPEITVLKNSGNGNATIKDIVGKYFRVESIGNGDIICKGTIDELDIQKTGNGDVNAKSLMTKKAKIQSSGNGNIVVNVSEIVQGNLTGNGDIQNIGKAVFNSKSTKKGNGNLIDKQ